MLPRIFQHNFRDPLQNVFVPNNIAKPLISSLSFKGTSEDIARNCEVEIVSSDPVGTDVIYALTQLPQLFHTREVDYRIRVPYVIPEMQEVYFDGVFTNSLQMNLCNFDKFDFLYTPFKFAEEFINAELEHTDYVSLSVAGHLTYHPTHRYPSEICGKLIVKNQKYPDSVQVEKQKNMCYRSCIFK